MENRRILKWESKGTKTFSDLDPDHGIGADFLPKGAFDQYFLVGGAKFDGLALSFFHLEKPGKLAEN